MTVASGKGGGWRNIVIAVFVTSLLWVSVLLVVSTTIHSAYSSPLAGVSETGADRVRFQQTLDNYNAIAKNMTVRIRTAEQALHQLQTRRAHPKTPPAPHAASKEKAAVVSRGDAGKEHSDNGGGDASQPQPEESEDEEEEAESDEGESDDEREERQKAEAAEQLTLIGYNETTKTFRRWRPDFKCGDRAPVLPDNEIVECEPGGESPCCSTLGWCGKSKAHCTCPLCVNYQEQVYVRFKRLKLTVEQRECENIAENLGKAASPEACAPLVLETVECGRSLMFAKDYPEWGCRCCGPSDTGSTEVHESWNVYEVEVEVIPK